MLDKDNKLSKPIYGGKKWIFLHFGLC